MHDHTIDPADEGRHAPGDDRFWSESWYMDFHRDDGSLGGYVRVGLYPNLGVTWYWACLVRAGQPLVTVIDNEAPLPRPPGLELRTLLVPAEDRVRGLGSGELLLQFQQAPGP